MSKPDTGFNVTFDNDYGRPCLICKPIKEDPEHKEKAMFHEWFVTGDVVPPRFNTSKNPLPWGQRSIVFGLVELEDGRMTQVSPNMITFVDGKVSNLFAETAVFCDKNDYGYPKHVEGFIKSCSFEATYNVCTTIRYITIKRFIEALEEYFDYRWNEDNFHMSIGSPSETTVEEFIYDGIHFEDLDRVITSPLDCIISLELAKSALKRYFDYEWNDEIYDKY